MTVKHTFNVHFWLKKTAIKKDGTVPVYARIWIDSLYIDVSTKEAVFEKDWCTKATRVKKRKENAKSLNETLDFIHSQIKKAYSQLKNEGSIP